MSAHKNTDAKLMIK